MKEPLLGVHASIAGGFPKALDRGEALGCRVLQIFVKNASQWRAKPIERDRAEEFRAAHAASPIGAIVAHASYLINLAATDGEILDKSRRALADELGRCAALGVEGLVLHPGAHLGRGEEAGIERVAESIDAVLGELPEHPVRLLLENTAGQGTVLGYRLEQLAAMRAASDHASRVGICLDTCHAFAAGYAVHEQDGLAELVDELDRHLGAECLGALHLNDSRKPFGSRRDRHANLGRGEMGRGKAARAAWRRILREPFFRGVPMILETPTGDDSQGYRDDLAFLRSL